MVGPHLTYCGQACWIHRNEPLENLCERGMVRVRNLFTALCGTIVKDVGALHVGY